MRVKVSNPRGAPVRQAGRWFLPRRTVEVDLSDSEVAALRSPLVVVDEPKPEPAPDAAPDLGVTDDGI